MVELDKKEIQRLKAILLPFFESTNTRRVYLFGSLSKGTATRRSDIDLMIETKTEKRFFDRYEDFESILALLPDRSVDLLIYTPDEISRIKHRAFIKSILEDGVIIYER